MAKKFGKFLLLTAAIGSAFGAAYYYLQKKNPADDAFDDDFDDFSEDTNSESEVSRNYVSLNAESKDEEKPVENNSFTPLAEQVEKVSEKAEETVEEFFDEDDPAEDNTSDKTD